jgi:hypothetical protein
LRRINLKLGSSASDRVAEKLPVMTSVGSIFQSELMHRAVRIPLSLVCEGVSLMRLVFGSIILAAMLGGVGGCGGVTEKEKQEAEKVPDLEIEDTTTTDKTEPERKGTTEAEPTKP